MSVVAANEKEDKLRGGKNPSIDRNWVAIRVGSIWPCL